MPIATKGEMLRAMADAIDGTITLEKMQQALKPFELHTSMLNELIRTVPPQAVLLILSLFLGTITFDMELTAPETDGLDWLELCKRHAIIAYDSLKRMCETDPKMQEYALSRVKRPAEPPREMTETERADQEATARRQGFSLLRFYGRQENDETDPAC